MYLSLKEIQLSVARLLPHFAAVICAIGICLIFIMMSAFALPVFTQSVAGNAGSVFSWYWNPGHGDFGILPMICGSLILSFFALALASPLAFGLCCHLIGAERGFLPAQLHNSLQKLLIALIRFMTAIPTVVYGFTAVFILVPLVREYGGGGSGLCLLSATIVLALLILPTMVLVIDAGLRPRFEKSRLTAAALGFTHIETLLYFALPKSRHCLLTAILLGFGRAMGDTLVSLMLAGNAPQVPLAISDSLRTLTAHMALVTSNDAGGAAYNSLFAAGAILLLINGTISLALRFLSKNNGAK